MLPTMTRGGGGRVGQSPSIRIGLPSDKAVLLGHQGEALSQLSAEAFSFGISGSGKF